MSGVALRYRPAADGLRREYLWLSDGMGAGSPDPTAGNTPGETAAGGRGQSPLPFDFFRPFDLPRSSWAQGFARETNGARLAHAPLTPAAQPAGIPARKEPAHGQA